MDDQLSLELEHWEGPLDLLLSLARAQKVDLRQISMVQLVEQYLAVIGRAAPLRLELAADWLVMAAWLAFLKSALLLPREPGEQPDADDLALRLRRRLERLDAMRDAGDRLMARDRLDRDVFTRAGPEGLSSTRQAHWQASLFDIIAAYGRISARTRPALHIVKPREVETLEDAFARVSALVGTAAEWRAIERFLPAAGSPRWARSALASSFLAALELARQGRVELRQAEPFAPLYLRAARRGPA